MYIPSLDALATSNYFTASMRALLGILGYVLADNADELRPDSLLVADHAWFETDFCVFVVFIRDFL